MARPVKATHGVCLRRHQGGEHVPVPAGEAGCAAPGSDCEKREICPLKELVAGGRPSPGYRTVPFGDFIPRNEVWLHRPEDRSKLDRAIRWAEEHPETAETDLDDLERRLDA